MSWDGQDRRRESPILMEMHSALMNLTADVAEIKVKTEDMHREIYVGNGNEPLKTRVVVLEKDINGILKREGNRNKAVISVAVGFIVTMVAVFLDVIRGK